MVKTCGEVKAAPTEIEEIQFLCTVCAKIKADPYLVNFFLEVIYYKWQYYGLVYNLQYYILAQPFWDYESYGTHSGVCITPLLKFCMPVSILHHSSDTTRCIVLKLSSILSIHHTYVNNTTFHKMPFFYFEIMVKGLCLTK